MTSDYEEESQHYSVTCTHSSDRDRHTDRQHCQVSLPLTKTYRMTSNWCFHKNFEYAYNLTIKLIMPDLEKGQLFLVHILNVWLQWITTSLMFGQFRAVNSAWLSKAEWVYIKPKYLHHSNLSSIITGRARLNETNKLSWATTLQLYVDRVLHLLLG